MGHTETEYRWVIDSTKATELLTLPKLTEIQEIEQHYIQYGGPTQIRARKSVFTGRRPNFTVTTKIKTDSVYTRLEFEQKIDESAYNELIKQSIGKVIKCRRALPIRFNANFVNDTGECIPTPMLEIDIYPGQDFMVAELETKSYFTLLDVVLPDWLGPEITGVKEYSNAYLAGLL